ncbi:rho GTPase-activating protein 24-like [Lissotriton helveticus]
MGLSCIKPWTGSTQSKKGGDGTQVSLSHDAYLFMAGRHSEVEKWMKAFSHMTWVPFTGVFGQTLENTILYERRHGERVAPMIVEQCVSFIRSWGLHEVGLFHQPGQVHVVKELQEAFDSGEKFTFDSHTDVHTVASLLQLYLQKLPDPVVPFSKYADLLACGALLLEDKEKGIQELKRQLADLPSINLNLLLYICRFLDEVQSHSTVNKMDVQNLASVFGPNLLRPKLQEPDETKRGPALVQQLMSVMISEHDKLFPAEDISHAAQPAQTRPRPNLACSFPRLCHEDHQREARAKSLSLPLTAGPGLPRAVSEKNAASNSWLALHEQTESCQSNSTDINHADSRPLPSKDLSAHAQGSHYRGLAPDPQAPTGLIADEHVDETRAEPQENGTFPTIPNVPDSCRAEPKFNIPQKNTTTFSCEVKLPIYDNIYFAPLLSSVEADCADRDSWCSSPCENMLEGKSSSRHSSRTSCALELSAATPTRASSVFGTVSSSNSYNSEVFLPTTDSSAGQNPLQCLVVGLKHQIANQKANYEAKIKSLEQQNSTLESEIKELHSNLDLQRKCYDIGEIKMRNAERARRDAERRNEMLQREMEQFFDTFGDLTSEVKKTARIVNNF